MNTSKLGGKLLATFAAFLLHTIAFTFLNPRIGAGAAPLSAVPVLIASWYFGIAGGVVASLLAIGLNTALFYVMGESGLEVLQHAGSVGNIALLATGLGAGYARTLYHRYEQEVSARRAAEEALRQSEGHFRELFEESPLGIAQLDETGRLVEVNPRLCEMFGYTAEELTALTFTNVTHPDDVQADLHQVQRLIAGLIPRYTMEKRYVRKDSSIFWANLTASAIFDDQGELSYLLGAVEDIDERKQAEDALHRRNRDLQLLNRVIVAAASQQEPGAVLNIACRELAQVFDLVQAGAALLDESGKRLRVVAQYSTRKGAGGVGEIIPVDGNTATQEVLSSKRPLIIADAQRDTRMAPVHQLMQEYGIVSIMLLPLLVNDNVVGTIGLDADRRRDFSIDDVQLAETAAAAVGPVLERAQLHARTKKQARQMEQVVESVPVGLLLLEQDRRVALANSLARNYLQQAGAYDDDARLRRFGETPVTSLLQAPPEDRPFHEVTTDDNRAAGGQQTTFEVRAATIEDDGWALVLNDVTVMREQARQLQAQERLAAVGQLSAGIAHDFNNILSVMTIYLQLLQRQPLPASALERLRILDAEAHRAAHLVQQMLDFSRKAVLRRQIVDLALLVQEHVAQLKGTLPDTVTVHFTREPDTYPVEADPARLRQALHNLIANAQEAMPDGGALRLSLSRFGPDVTPPLPDMRRGDWLCLSVGDNGKGVESRHLAYVFEPFYTTKGPGEGSGLGLAQVYGVVRQHGGFVGVESEVGQGTTVTLYLPAV